MIYQIHFHEIPYNRKDIKERNVESEESWETEKTENLKESVNLYKKK